MIGVCFLKSCWNESIVSFSLIHKFRECIRPGLADFYDQHLEFPSGYLRVAKTWGNNTTTGFLFLSVRIGRLSGFQCSAGLTSVLSCFQPILADRILIAGIYLCKFSSGVFPIFCQCIQSYYCSVAKHSLLVFRDVVHFYQAISTFLYWS